jgi:hypothetical protein
LNTAKWLPAGSSRCAKVTPDGADLRRTLDPADRPLAVLLGLVAGRRAGLVTTSATAMESAAAKIRGVLPEALGRRLDALLATADFTTAAHAAATQETGVLLMLAEAAPAGRRQLHRPGREAQRTHRAPVRDRRPLRALVRGRGGLGQRRSTHVPA